jgi:transposase-like protein
VHKTANILDKMPKSVQGKAKQLIHEICLAPTRKAALAAYDQFISSYQIKFPKACAWKDKKSFLPFTTFRPNISRIYGLPTPSNQPSLPSGCEPAEPRVAVHESRH